MAGAIVSVYNAGQAVGGMISGFVADKYSRKYAMSAMAFLCKFPPYMPPS